MGLGRRQLVVAALGASVLAACRGSGAVPPSTSFNCQTSADCLDGYACREQQCVEGPRGVLPTDGGGRDAGPSSPIDALDALGEVVMHFDFRRGLELDDDGGVIAWHATTPDAGLTVTRQALPTRRPQLYDDGLGRPPHLAEVYLEVVGAQAVALSSAITAMRPHVLVFVARVSSNGSTANAGLTPLYLRDTVTGGAIYGPGVLRDGRVRDLTSLFLPFAGRGFVDGARTLFVYRWYGDGTLTVSAGSNTITVSHTLAPSANPFGYLAQIGDYQGGLVEARLQLMLLTALPGGGRAEVDAHVDTVLRLLRADDVYAPLVP